MPSATEAKRLREFFLEAGYEEKSVRQGLGITDLPSSKLRNLAALMDRTRELSLLHILLRWFWIGIPQERSIVKDLVPSWFLASATSCGLLRLEMDSLSPGAMLIPVEGFLIASDHTSRVDAADADLVLWPNPTSRLLSRFAVRRHSRATLDLGAGNGIQALSAAHHSDTLVATDLNARAVEFCAFNARLNGIENVECLVGDGFAPVAGRTFDLIVTNPPFFITPSNRYLFCDNPMDLDQLCRRLVREAPSHLNEGGYFQMLCEWAQVSGETWQERIAEWTHDIGCDAWILKGNTQDPSDYALDRIRETSLPSQQDAELYAGYMDYYRKRSVEAIHMGLVAMRRRSGHNWTFIEEISHTPRDPFGESVMAVFSARDFLASHGSDDEMLPLKPKLLPHIRLEQIYGQGAGGWQPASLTLRAVEGFPSFLAVQPLVAEFLGVCDGCKTLGELTEALATKVDAPLEQVRKECTSIVRTLIERGFVVGLES